LRYAGAKERRHSRVRACETPFTPVKRSIVLNEAKWCVVDVFSTLMWCFLVGLFAYLQAVGKASTSGAAASGVAIGSLFMVYEYSQRAGGVLTAVAAHFQSLVRQQSDYAAAEPIYAAPANLRSLMHKVPIGKLCGWITFSFFMPTVTKPRRPWIM